MISDAVLESLSRTYPNGFSISFSVSPNAPQGKTEIKEPVKVERVPIKVEQPETVTLDKTKDIINPAENCLYTSSDVCYKEEAGN